MNIKTTNTQIKIFRWNGGVVYDYLDMQIFPLFKSGDYRIARALENKGIGGLVSSSKNCYHAANYFFKFNHNYRFNYRLNTIEKYLD